MLKTPTLVSGVVSFELPATVGEIYGLATETHILFVCNKRIPMSRVSVVPVRDPSQKIWRGRAREKSSVKMRRRRCGARPSLKPWSSVYFRA